MGIKRNDLVIDLDENMEVHCKAYIQPSFDALIKKFQIDEIETTGQVVTYSEAVRRLMIDGLRLHYGDRFKLKGTGLEEV